MQRDLVGICFTVCLLTFATAAAGDASGVRQPPLGTFKIRKELTGRHPRLYFSRKDVPKIRRLARGPSKWFLDKAKSNFAGRLVGKGVKQNMAGWERYLYGFWGLTSLDMFYVVEGDPKYADTAKTIVKWLLDTKDWGGDDLIPMDMLSGLAITYDILYDRFTEQERRAIRERMLKEMEFIHGRFFVGQYWTGDYQNNHMHNRIHGLANAAFAMYGDDPKMNVQKYADLAVSQFRKVVEWLPEDGSTHEGPGYWSYGHHWVVRAAHLLEHVTGEDVASKNAHFRNSHYFRLYMTAPGWKRTLNIGDSGDGPPSNLTTLCRSVAEAKDPHGQAFIQQMMKVNPGEFYQHPAWGLLWYDPSIRPKPVEDLPLGRFWPDLEMLSVRSSWKADATAFVFKCGPPGGHRMQRIRKGRYVNVAHDHPDQNHFLLFAHGKMLAADDGYPKQKKLARSHNTITIDGKGQPREGTGWYQPFDYEKTGFLRDMMLSGSSAYAVGDASTLYEGAAKYLRHAVFVEGEYVILLDDLVGAGGREHTFEWRLHKKGKWSKLAADHFRVVDADISLDVRFLAPAAKVMEGAFLPAELTAAPCLAVKTRERGTRFLAVLVPQKSGKPAVKAERLSRPGCVGVRVETPAHEDLFGAAERPGAFRFGEAEARGSAALVRLRKGKPQSVILARGVSLSVGGKLVVSASKASNLSWRRTARGVRVEAERPYESLKVRGASPRRARGGKITVRIGGLTGGMSRTVLVDGKREGSFRPDARGVVKVPVDLTERRVIAVR